MYFQIISASPNFITEAKKCWVYWPELVMISIQMDCVCVISGSDLQVLLVSNSCQHMFIFKSFPKQYLNLSISPVHCRYRPVGHLVVYPFLYYSSVKALDDFSCKLCRIFIAPLRDELHETLHQSDLATFFVAAIVAKSRTGFYFVQRLLQQKRCQTCNCSF